MTDQPKLKACPVCGKAAQIHLDIYYQGVNMRYVYWPSCKDLKCLEINRVFDTREEAVAAWNTRADESMDLLRCLYDDMRETDKLKMPDDLRERIERAIGGEDGK